MDPTLQAIVSAALSFSIVTFLLGLIILVCKSSRKPPSDHPVTRSVNPTRPARNNRELTSFSTFDSASFDPTIHRISMAELAAATKNFSSELVVGDGSFGLVYKATLENGVTVAIKKLDPDAFQGFREFRAEMETLDKLRHPNIVKILGYCCAGRDRVLIYEFIERGSLDQWLHDTSAGDEAGQLGSPYPLSWATRIKVVKGVAHGLAYLHGLETPIIHRDIKSSNVLLDMDFEAHIADFGLARQINGSYTHVSTQVAGTMGYMPPEYMAGITTATMMADVYSFGVLMIEIATQRRPNWPVTAVDGKEVGLMYWARNMVHEKREMEMLDENLSKEGLEESKVREYFRIACSCSGDNPRERPEMGQVVQLLNQITTL